MNIGRLGMWHPVCVSLHHLRVLGLDLPLVSRAMVQL
jgi:hypothetical protein